MCHEFDPSTTEDPRYSAHEDQGLLCPSQYTWPLSAEMNERMSRSGGQSESSPHQCLVPKQAWYSFIDPLQ
ncbi:hypothetical protein TNCV_568201 [Trichonephila clavipes]|nr:hypothetical protein TNCV_568201 [Trichonephila clavipes]